MVKIYSSASERHSMGQGEAKPVLAALDETLDLSRRAPLQDEIDVAAIQQLRAHGGEFELRFEAWGHEVVVTESDVSVTAETAPTSSSVP
jgi:hypothetical protein